MFDGTDGTTTEVGSEAAVAEPSTLLAVTTERMVWPASPDASVWLDDVAPLMVLQLLPELSQSCHAYA